MLKGQMTAVVKASIVPEEEPNTTNALLAALLRLAFAGGL
jgi:hypothetical protein